jgi:hypothetical protein
VSAAFVARLPSVTCSSHRCASLSLLRRPARQRRSSALRRASSRAACSTSRCMWACSHVRVRRRAVVVRLVLSLLLRRGTRASALVCMCVFLAVGAIWPPRLWRALAGPATVLRFPTFRSARSHRTRTCLAPLPGRVGSCRARWPNRYTNGQGHSTGYPHTVSWVTIPGNPHSGVSTPQQGRAHLVVWTRGPRG